MTIAIGALPDVVTQANAYLSLLKVREAVASGAMTFEVAQSGNHYDLVALFGLDAIRGVVLPALDNYIEGKKAELEAIGIQP
jgi:hypothetical protein